MPSNAIQCEIVVLNIMSVTLEPKSKKGDAFWIVQSTLVYHIELGEIELRQSCDSQK